MLVDAGNFAELKPPHPWEKTTFVFDVMAGLGYDVVTPGDSELRPGIDSLRALVARHPEVRMVSANLKSKSGAYVFPQFTVIEKNGIRFGVTGTTGPEYYQQNVRQALQSEDDFTFEDSKTALERVVPQLRAQADVVVVLLNEMVDSAMKLTTAVPGIDVAVAGHDPGVLPAPEKLGDAIFIRPGNRGQYVYRVPLVLDPASKRVSGYAGRALMLDALMAKDADTDSTVVRWEKGFKDRYNQPVPYVKPVPAGQ